MPLARTLLVLLWQAAAPSWPAWRGADGTNVSPEIEWSTEAAPEPLWRAVVGRGHSSVTLADGVLFTQGFDEERAVDRVVALDALTGVERWRYEYPAELDADMHAGGTHATPVVDAGVVFSFERQGVLRALDAKSGTLRWERDLVADHGARATDYGFGSSAVVAGELVLVNAAKVFALDRRDGATRWVTEDLGAYYSTPALCRFGGTDWVASFARPGLYVLGLSDGGVRHHFPFVKGATSVSASTPVQVGDALLFVSSGYGHGGALVDLGGDAPRARWETKAMRTQLTGCTLLGGHLYGFDESVLKCLGLDGVERWRRRGLGMGALTAAGERLLVLSEDGELVVVAADPEEYRELSRRPALSGGPCWAPPVLCGGVVYARSAGGELAALDHRAGRSR